MRIKTKLLFTFSFIALIFLVNAMVTLYNVRIMGSQFNYLVEHDLNVLQNAQKLHKLVVDAETGLRGYVITKKDGFLEPFNNALDNFDNLYNKELKLVSDNKQQVERLIRIKSLFLKWQKEAANPEILVRRNGTLLHAKQLIDLETGKNILDQIRKEFTTFIQIENDLEKERKIRAQKVEYNTNQVVIFGITISLIILLVAALVILKSILPAIKRILSATNTISEGNLTVKIPIVGNDELSELATSFNSMAESLQLNDKELVIKNELLESQNRELEHFAYIVSHDLKAPLRTIHTLSDFIDQDLKSGDNEAVQSHLNIVKSRIERMEGLIEGILDFAKIGMLKSKKEHIDLNILVADVYHMMDVPEHFELQIETVLPTVYAVKTLYIQLFSNIISNALKFNDKEVGLIKISYTDLPESHKFTILDNGPGIPKAFQEKVFLAFQTLNARDSFESTGIGLSIVQKIINIFNGTIRIESIENVETKFIIEIPKN